CLNAGNGVDAPEDLLEVCALLLDFGFVISRVVVVDADGCGGRWLEAEIDVEDVKETAEEEACSYDEDAGEGYFGDDEGGTEALVFAAVAHTGAGVFEGFLDVDAGHFE